MKRIKQIVKWEIGKDYLISRNQMIVNISIDNYGYAFGLWNGRQVASFHIDNGTWFVI